MARLGFACKIIWEKAFSTQVLWALPLTKNVLLPFTTFFFLDLALGLEVQKWLLYFENTP